MKQGICSLSNIPVRKEPGSRSELVNMLLFGETYSILEMEKGWYFIQSDFDEYKGWVNDRQFSEMVEKPSNSLVLDNFPFTILDCQGEHIMALPGSQIPIPSHGNFIINGLTYFTESPPDVIKKDMISYARNFLNTPYLWGGRSPFGIDCSGFTQIVYKVYGIPLKRDAWQQAEQGNTVAFMSAALPGDLAFFDNDDGKIIHTGIMIDSEHIIHASGHVRIDRIDQYGIMNSEKKEYSHKLRIIKRFQDSIVM